MSRYLSVDGLKGLCAIPASFIDDVEAMEPGWTARQLVRDPSR